MGNERVVEVKKKEGGREKGKKGKKNLRVQQKKRDSYQRTRRWTVRSAGEKREQRWKTFLAGCYT